jgi:hypothetical protein
MSYSNINKSTDFFNTKLYQGNGSTQTLTGIGFNADLIWLKNRTDSSTSHVLTDSVRTNPKYLKSNAADSEGTYTFVSNRGSDGYDVASHSWSGASSKNYVAWNWLAGGTASSNTDGSITSSVSANTTAGFSVVSYTGTGANATIGHGIDTPKMIIVKNRDQSDAWYVYHSSLGGTKFLSLNDTGSAGTNSTIWNNTDPTSSVFSVGTNNVSNTSGEKYIAYLFAENASKLFKIGSYVGNGSSNGRFIHTGGNVVWVMIKNTEGTDNWNIYDNKRLGYNTNYSFLSPNLQNAENTTTSTANLDLLSSGFKIKSSTGHLNTSGDKYIYMAIQQPIVGQNNIPCTAR